MKRSLEVSVYDLAMLFAVLNNFYNYVPKTTQEYEWLKDFRSRVEQLAQEYEGSQGKDE